MLCRLIIELKIFFNRLNYLLKIINVHILLPRGVEAREISEGRTHGSGKDRIQD